MRYLNVDIIAGKWKYHVLKIIANRCYHDENIRKETRQTTSSLYRKDKRFFFNIGDGDISNTEGIIRYLACSPIAEYKITGSIDDEVSFFFYDLANDKKKCTVTMPIRQFISQVLIHLPPKNFKMVNRYEFYSRHISEKLKEAIEPF